MKLATLDDGSGNGRLVIVSRDLGSMIWCGDIAPTLQYAMENWTKVEPKLSQLADALEDGEIKDAQIFMPNRMKAPLPGSVEWLDGALLCVKARGAAAIDEDFTQDQSIVGKPEVREFIAGHVDLAIENSAVGIDFGAEIAVVIDAVPQGISAEDALAHIKLVMLVNDWSVGGVRADYGLPCGAAPVAVTPDELGDRWREGRVHLPLMVHHNGKRFASVEAGMTELGFHELIARAAHDQSLRAGTIIGSALISEPSHMTGFRCIAQRREMERAETGSSKTPFMHSGEYVRVEVRQRRGSLFGSIEQRVSVAA